jgi:hypothetical protein
MIEGLVAAEAACPTVPSVMAAMAGAKIAAAAWAAACERATGQKLGTQGNTSEARVTASAAPATSARLARVASTRAPAGVCANRPARVAIDITTPMLASSQR